MYRSDLISKPNSKFRVLVEFMELFQRFSQILSSYFGCLTLGKKINEEDMQRMSFNTYSENTNNIIVVSIFTKRPNL